MGTGKTGIPRGFRGDGNDVAGPGEVGKNVVGLLQEHSSFVVCLKQPEVSSPLTSFRRKNLVHFIYMDCILLSVIPIFDSKFIHFFITTELIPYLLSVNCCKDE